MKFILKNIFLFVSLCYFNSVCCQSLDEFLSLENKSKKENQEFFILNGYSVIDQKNTYTYSAAKKCNPPRFFELDTCKWQCSRGIHKPIFSKIKINLNEVKFETYEGELVKAKNFDEKQYFEFNYAKNYNYSNKTASKFVDLSFGYNVDNFNCENRFDYKQNISNSFFAIEIQFVSKVDWQKFKNEITEKAKFVKTYKDYEGLMVVQYSIYKKSEFVNDIYSKIGTKISYREKDNISLVTISFECMLD